MFIYLFTCKTKDCENKDNPVRLVEPTNPVLCGACGAFSNAVKTDEVWETPEEVIE